MERLSWYQGMGSVSVKEGKQEGLTCRQSMTPEAQEKQQPCPSHGPLVKRHDPVAAVSYPLGEEAPLVCLPGHRPSCTTAALPYP